MNEKCFVINEDGSAAVEAVSIWDLDLSIDTRQMFDAISEEGKIILRPYRQADAFETDDTSLQRFATFAEERGIHLTHIYEIPYEGIRDNKVFVLSKISGARLANTVLPIIDQRKVTLKEGQTLILSLGKL